ncbi:MAG: hypothetical protein ACNI27_01710 [Desulfovibrio sp.]
MSKEVKKEESESDIIQALEAEKVGFQEELELCIKNLREYEQKEDLKNGIYFAQEIFTCKQDKLRLAVEIELREKKIRRIQLGIPDSAANGPVQDANATLSVF